MSEEDYIRVDLDETWTVSQTHGGAFMAEKVLSSGEKLQSLLRFDGCAQFWIGDDQEQPFHTDNLAVTLEAINLLLQKSQELWPDVYNHKVKND